MHVQSAILSDEVVDGLGKRVALDPLLDSDAYIRAPGFFLEGVCSKLPVFVRRVHQRDIRPVEMYRYVDHRPRLVVVAGHRSEWEA